MANNNILAQMLLAAEKAAQGVWGQVSSSVTGFSKDLLQSTAQVAEDYADGKISEDEAHTDFEALADYSDMLADYAEDAVKVAAQNAFNAAIDTLWNTIANSVKV